MKKIWAIGLSLSTIAMHAAHEPAPSCLYKITSPALWQQSQQQDRLIITEQDNDFIHLAREDQLEAIIEKFWRSQQQAYTILKLDTSKLQGELIFEANRPNGNKYYHLYHGYIPLSAIIEVITI